MKYFSTVFILLYSIHGFAQIPQKTLQDFDLKGPVSRLTYQEYYARDSSNTTVKGKLIPNSDNYLLCFNERGYNTENRKFTDDGKMLKLFLYNDLGLEKRTCSYNDNSFICSDYVLNENGQRLITKRYSEIGDTLHAYYIYNENGQIKEHKQIDHFGTTVFQYFNSYNEQDEISRSEWFKNGEFDHAENYEYDSTGQVVNLCVVDWLGNYGSCNESKYDLQGRLIEQSTIENGELQRMMQFEYDSLGHRTREVFFDVFMQISSSHQYFYRGDKLIKLVELDRNGKPTRIEKHSYNEQGDLIRLDYVSTQDGTSLFFHQWEYIYDNYGNWIQKIMIQGTKAHYLIERSIVYY
ncbi:MAG: hypothetical protein R2780_14915 [Crocinitomicaceae bacterium]|nr:hypothetical protein [Crocinitomicaceae bacterium]